MATTNTLEVALSIRAAIDQKGETIQGVARAAGLTPRTFREHLAVGKLTMDEVFAAARVLEMSAGDFLPAEHRSSAHAA